MTLTMPEIGLEILVDLDFDPDLPCEHPHHAETDWHEGSAAFIIDRHPPCGCQRSSRRMAICRRAWVVAGRCGLRCGTCGHVCSREDRWTLVGSVK